jgi:hypothetical protein
MTGFDAETVLEALLRCQAAFTDWEREFLASVEKQNAYKGLISEKQEAIIRRIATQYRVDVAKFTAHWRTNEHSESELQGFRGDNKLVDEWISHRDYWQDHENSRQTAADGAGEAWLRANFPRFAAKKRID